MARVFKILPAEDWTAAVANSVYLGSALDLKDGFIHFSDASQAQETAARHFAGQTGLTLVAFDEQQFGEQLRWESSRGGALFPHLYSTVDPQLALWAKPLPWDGLTHQFPDGWDQ
jgi:uncharacterized protein (DUF952 family)